MRALFTALMLILPAAPLAAQDDFGNPFRKPLAEVSVSESIVRIELEDGSSAYGTVREVRGDTVRIELVSGDVMEVQRRRIRSVHAFEGRIVDGRAWQADPNETRLFFGPTARSLRSGEGYLAMYYAVMPFAALGVGERVTLAGGAPLFLGEGMFQVFWLAPKVEVYRGEKARAAVGALSFFAADEGSAGVLYGVTTFGRTSDAAMTLGAGYGYTSGDGIGDTPAVMFGLEKRMSPGVKLISENYLFLNDGLLLAIGPRFIGDRLTADLAMVVPAFGGSLVAVPFVNFVWNW